MKRCRMTCSANEVSARSDNIDSIKPSPEACLDQSERARPDRIEDASAVTEQRSEARYAARAKRWVLACKF